MENHEVKNKKKRIVYEIVNTIITFLVCLVIMALVTSYIARPVHVDGNSMYPTLNDGDVSLSFLMGIDRDDIERFDIVVLYIEEENKYIVKRVVGLPNETVSIENDQLYIDGVLVEQTFLDETYVESQSVLNHFTSDVESITLGDNEFFVLGDNRPNSLDSRAYGAFQSEQIVSKDIFVMFPFNRIGLK